MSFLGYPIGEQFIMENNRNNDTGKITRIRRTTRRVLTTRWAPSGRILLMTVTHRAEGRFRE